MRHLQSLRYFQITSAGGLVLGLSKDEFFEGYSIPRNKEFMRIFKDLDMVESLGSGIPRILRVYPKECFRFTDNFVRMSFPKTRIESRQGGQVELTNRQKEILEVIKEYPEISRNKLAQHFGINESAIQKHLNPLKQKGSLERIRSTIGEWKIIYN